MSELLSMAALLGVGMAVARRRNNGLLSLDGLLLLIVGLYFPARGLMLVLMDDSSLRWENARVVAILMNQEAMRSVFGLTSVVVGAIVVGYVIGGSSASAGASHYSFVPQVVAVKTPIRWMFVLTLPWVAVTGMSFARIELPAALSALADAMTSLHFICVVLLVATGGRWTWVWVLPLLLMGLPFGSKDLMLQALLAYASGSVLARRGNPWQISARGAATATVLTLVFLALLPSVQATRQANYAIAGASVVRPATDASGLAASVSARLHGLDSLAVAWKHGGGTEPELLSWTAIAALPMSGVVPSEMVDYPHVGQYFAVRVWGSPPSTLSSIAPTIFGQAYLAHGLGGLTVVSLVFGLLLGWAPSRLRRARSLLSAVTLLLVVRSLLMFERDVWSIISSLQQSLIVVVLVVHVVLLAQQRSTSRVAAVLD